MMRVRTAAVGGENLKFIPRCTPTAMRNGVQPCLFFVFQTSIVAPLSD